jgi:hypothetical protein
MVDLKKNTFTVLLDGTGVTRTYRLPGKVNIIDRGVTRHDRNLIGPGQPVQLKFMETVAKPRMGGVISGVVVSLDRNTGKGVLKAARSNRFIPFRLTEDLKIRHAAAPIVGEQVEFTYVMQGGEITALE